MICQQCHSEVDDDNLFCPNCGADLRQQNNNQSNIYQSQQQYNEQMQNNNAQYYNGQAQNNNNQIPNGNQQFYNRQMPNGNQQFYNGQMPNGNPQYYNGAMPNASNQNNMKMKWYKFIIYFQLFFISFVQISMGILYIVGTFFYETQVVDGIVFLDETKVINIIYGICCIILGVIAIVVRMNMAKFKKNALKMYFGMIIVNMILQMIYSILLIIVVQSYGIDVDYTNVGSILIWGGIYLVLNKEYFKKRAYMFVN